MSGLERLIKRQIILGVQIQHFFSYIVWNVYVNKPHFDLSCAV